MAEKVKAGSVPIATATSIFPLTGGCSGSTEPPEVRAIISTRRDAACRVSRANGVELEGLPETAAARRSFATTG
jgi:hypothetical protein